MRGRKTERVVRVRRRRRRSVWRSAAIVAAIFSVPAATIAVEWWATAALQTPAATPVVARRPAPPVSATREIEALLNASPTGRAYPYSIVPGGVRSSQEVVDAMARDRVVANHYRLVSASDLRTERVTNSRLVYMSYRIGDKVYWTKRPMRLNAGETILTDGVNQIRTRCGNCLSLEPLGPSSDDEPDPIEFEGLFPPVDDPVVPGDPSLLAVPAGFAAGASPAQLAPVPEPGTLLLFGGGAAVWLTRHLTRRRKKSPPDDQVPS
jgi:hypothetical protein